MFIKFNNATVIEAVSRTSSKSGRKYGKLRFISEDMDVFDLFVNERCLSFLETVQPKDQVTLVFELRPAYRGGVELVLNAIE